MRTSTIALLAGLVVSGLAAQDVSAGVKTPPGFANTHAKALAQAKKDNKPLYLHFTTDWCGWCRRIEEDVYANAKGKEALAAFVPASLDCTNNAPGSKANQALMEKYGGSGYPFIVILAPDGAVLESWAGYRPLERFVPTLEKAQKKFDTYNAFLEKTKSADPKDLGFQIEAMDVYVAMQQWDKADIAARKVIELDKDRTHFGKAKLTQLRVAREKKNFQAVTNLTAEVRKLDPDNAKQLLEIALGEQVEAIMLQANNKNNETQYKKALAILVERTKLANLSDPKQATVDIASLQMSCGKYREAWTTLEKWLADNPDSPDADRTRELIDKLKQAEAKQQKR
ncbi:MAG: thioredoxin family protein [Phycisphaerae bacterium]|nr:thioredoxin family protein [Phycisphaerae bacterium]